MKLKIMLAIVALVLEISLLPACSVSALIPKEITSSVVNSKNPVMAQANIDSKIPKNIYPCLPRQVQDLKLWAHTKANQSNYYLIGIYQQHSQQMEEFQPQYQETLVELDNVGCLVVVPKQKMGAVSLVQYVPEQVARELKLQRYRQAIAQVGGKEKFQDIFIEQESQSPGDVSYYFPEDVWALERLGIKLPDNARVIENVDELESQGNN